MTLQRHDFAVSSNFTFMQFQLHTIASLCHFALPEPIVAFLCANIMHHLHQMKQEPFCVSSFNSMQQTSHHRANKSLYNFIVTPSHHFNIALTDPHDISLYQHPQYCSFIMLYHHTIAQ
jgi:hypothetical protein